MRFHTILLILCCIGSLQVFSQTSSVTFFSDDGNAFILYLDGVQQNKGAQTRVKVGNLPGPYHSVRLEFAQSSIPALERKNVSVVDSDQRPASVSYKVRKDKKGNPRLIFYAMLPPEPPSSKTTEEVPAVEEKEPVAPTPSAATKKEPSKENKAILSNVSGATISLPAKKDEVEKQAEKGVTYESKSDVPKPKAEVKEKPLAPKPAEKKPAANPLAEKKWEEGPNKKCNDWPMMKEEFNRIKQPVAEASNEKSKLQRAKKMVQENCLLVSQVSEVAQLFKDSENRFAFVKYVHGAVIDRPNFDRLKNLFSEPNYIDLFQQHFSNK